MPVRRFNPSFFQKLCDYCNDINDNLPFGVSSLLKDTSARKVELSHLTVDNKVAEKIVWHLQKNNEIEEFNLSYGSQLTAVGLKTLLDVLASKPRLRKLVLFASGIDDSGVNEIAQFLSSNHTVKELYLSENKITCNGISVLASALDVNRSLESLHLQFNRISNQGVQALSASLRTSNNLRTVRLEVEPPNVSPQIYDDFMEANNFARSIKISLNAASSIEISFGSNSLSVA